MKIVVIGGAGYIGSHVARELLDRGHQVTVFDNLSTGTRENLFSDEEFIHGDILATDSLRQAFSQGFEALIHLAASKAAGESMIKPEKYSVNNITGTLNILNAASEAGIGNIVFSSSAAAYGEPQYLPIDEDHPTVPENYYGFTKLQIEGFIRWYEKLKGIRSASLRYFNAAGYDAAGRITGLEQNSANLLPVIMEVAMGWRNNLQIFGDDYDTEDGTGVRDYIHVSDLARAHAAALEYITEKKQSLTVNLGSESGLSVLQILETTRKISGKKVPVEVVGRRPGDPGKLVASSAKAKELLGWKATESDVDSLVSTSWNAYGKAIRL